MTSCAQVRLSRYCAPDFAQVRLSCYSDLDFDPGFRKFCFAVRDSVVLLAGGFEEGLFFMGACIS